MSRHLFTTEPLPKPPQGYVPMNRAAICLDCSVLFFIMGNCPNCCSEQILPLATWMERERSA